MLHWIRGELIRTGFDESTIRKLELASEEALVNVIRHAYKEQQGSIEIDIHSNPKNSLRLSLGWRIPFNPLSLETKVDPLAPLEERTEGGLGILFMRQYT